MSAPPRAEAIATLEEGHRRTADLLAGVAEEDLTRPSSLGGGDWSVKDLLGHVAAWEQLALDALGSWREGRMPEAERIFTQQGGVDLFNAQSVPAKAPLPLDEIRAEWERTHGTLVGAIEGMTDDEWREKAPYPTEWRGTLGELLGSITGAPKRPFGHAFAHIEDLEAFVSSVRARDGG